MAKKSNNKKKKSNSLLSNIKKAVTSVTKASNVSKTDLKKATQKAVNQQKTAQNKKSAAKTQQTIAKTQQKKTVGQQTKQTKNKSAFSNSIKNPANTSLQNSLKTKKSSQKSSKKSTGYSYYSTNKSNAALDKLAVYNQLKKQGKQAYKDTVKQHKDTYGSISDEQKKAYKKQINSAVNKATVKSNRSIDKQMTKADTKSTAKLTKKESEAYSKAKIGDIYASRSGAAQRARRKQEATTEQFLENNPKVVEKLKTQQIQDYQKHSGIYGLAEGALPVNIDDKNLRKYYTDDESEAIQKAKDKTSYKVGYGVGTVGSFFVGGGGGAAENAIKTGLKGAMKVGSKKVVQEAGQEVAKGAAKSTLKTASKKELKSIVRKNLSDDVAKVVKAEIKKDGTSKTLNKIVDNTWNSLKLTGKDKAKSFVASRAADAAVSTPFNVADAIKQSTNAKGETDWKQAAKNFGVNTAMDMTIGGAVDAASLLKGNTYKKLTNLIAKKNSGQKLTKSESEWYESTMKKVREGNASKAQTKAVNKAAEDYAGTNAFNVKSADANIKSADANVKSDVPETNVGKKSAAEAEPVKTKTEAAKAKSEKKLVDAADTKAEVKAETKAEVKTEKTETPTAKNDRTKTDVGVASEKEVAEVNKALGVDVTDFEHSVDNAAVKESSDAVEETLRDVVENADTVKVVDNPADELVEAARAAGKEDLPIVTFTKEIDGENTVVHAVVDAENKEVKVISASQTLKDTPQTRLRMQVDEMRRAGKSDDEILEELEKQGVSPVDALKAVDDDIADDFVAQATKAAENAENEAHFDTQVEKIKHDNPTPKQAYARANERISREEVPQARETARKQVNQVDDDVAEIIEPWVREGLYNKKVLESQQSARAKAAKEMENGTCYEKFMDMTVEENEHLFMARAEALLTKIGKEAVNDDDAAMALMEVLDKASEATSHGGRLLNAAKMLLRNTPQGRVRMVEKEVLNLQNKYAYRLGGRTLKLSDDMIQKILKADDDTIQDVVEEIENDIWDNQIGATLFEKMNEIRRFSMLANPKTHLRNFFGNSIFMGFRKLADTLEVGFYKIPAIKKHIDNLGGSIEMVRVTHKDIAPHKEYLEKLWEKNYKNVDAKNKYIETTRPDGSPVIRTKWLNTLIQKNYDALEWEDVSLAMKHEYNKNYIRWCKSQGIDLKHLDDMTKAQKLLANGYAMKQAEYATFRDNSKIATAITRFKEKTASSDKVAWRAANVVMESQLPFVKTPINILRRSIDFSPISLLRAMNSLRKVSDVETFKAGIHQLSTGLTGTGVFLLGAALAANDLVTVEAGKVSGSEYYDRDMGYQDYSINAHLFGKDYSFTIDWISPMQTSLFMGANLYGILNQDGLSTADIFDGLTTVLDPMLEMSFMSSAKDTVETLMETWADGGWSDAMVKTLGGSVPQGYLSSFIPQIVSQAAGAMDNKKRDTRSTKEDPLVNSWESFTRKIANRIPVLRQKVLNPKIDRFGNDVDTGNNLAMRVVNAFLNPSTTKEIKVTKTDKEIIKIYKHMEDGDDKEMFFYNFTGNPSYELANGKRMSYNDLYKYGKSSRIDQTKSINTMIKSSSYKNMTWSMKSDEVSSAHWNAEMTADRKTYGSKYLINKVLKSEYSSETDKQAIKLARSTGTVSDNVLSKYMISKEKLIARSHASDYYTQAMAIALYGNDALMKVYSVNLDKVTAAKEYVASKGEAAFKTFTDASCNILSGLDRAEATTSTKNKAIAAVDFDIDEETYHALGITTDVANMGYGIKKFGYSFEALEAMKMNAKYSFDTDQSGTLKKSEIQAYIDSLGLETNEEKAIIFAYFSSAKNPYGNIPNYLFGDGSFTESSSSSKSSRKRSSSRRSSSGSSSSSDVGTWEDWVKDHLNDDYQTVTFKEWDSPVDSAYIKKIQKILKNKVEA